MVYFFSRILRCSTWALCMVQSTLAKVFCSSGSLNFFDSIFCSTCIPTYVTTAWKLSKYGAFSGPYFPVFGQNTGKYGQKKTPYFDTFHAVNRKSLVNTALIKIILIHFTTCLFFCSAVCMRVCVWHIVYYTAWKVSVFGVSFGPYFPAFGLNTER